MLIRIFLSKQNILVNMTDRVSLQLGIGKYVKWCADRIYTGHTIMKFALKQINKLTCIRF